MPHPRSGERSRHVGDGQVADRPAGRCRLEPRNSTVGPDSNPVMQQAGGAAVRIPVARTPAGRMLAARTPAGPCLRPEQPGRIRAAARILVGRWSPGSASMALPSSPVARLAAGRERLAATPQARRPDSGAERTMSPTQAEGQRPQCLRAGPASEISWLPQLTCTSEAILLRRATAAKALLLSLSSSCPCAQP